MGCITQPRPLPEEAWFPPAIPWRLALSEGASRSCRAQALSSLQTSRTALPPGLHIKVRREGGPWLTPGRSPSCCGVRAFLRPWSLVSRTVTVTRLVGARGQRGQVSHSLQPRICPCKLGLPAAASSRGSISEQVGPPSACVREPSDPVRLSVTRCPSGRAPPRSPWGEWRHASPCFKPLPLAAFYSCRALRGTLVRACEGSVPWCWERASSMMSGACGVPISRSDHFHRSRTRGCQPLTCSEGPAKHTEGVPFLRLVPPAPQEVGREGTRSGTWFDRSQQLHVVHIQPQSSNPRTGAGEAPGPTGRIPRGRLPGCTEVNWKR